MIGFVVAVSVFGLLAAFVLRLADEDLEKRGGLGAIASISLWLLYLFHADTVAAAAFTDLGRIDVPAGRSSQAACFSRRLAGCSSWRPRCRSSATGTSRA